MSTTFIFVILISLADKSPQAKKERSKFNDQFYRAISGKGIEQGKGH
jgi:cation/acetate symporter